MAKIIEFGKKNEKEVVDNIFRLEEMVDAMTKSLDNAYQVKKEQEILLSIVKENITKDGVDFTEFCNNLEKQIESMTSQISVLADRRDLLIEVVDCCKSCDEDIKRKFNMLLAGLGVFGE